MNILSLFDGISCGRVALERVGIPVDKYYASEIDKYAIQIALKNYADTIQLGDVNNFEYWNLPKIDLLIGGSPCQDLSISKKDRTGLDGDRSGLFWKYVDCLKKFKPKWFLLENVASMSKEAKDRITETLGVQPIMINSSLVSAQQRRRLYWTNIPNIMQPIDKEIVVADILESGVGVACSNQGHVISRVVEKARCLMARDYKGFGNQEMTGVAVPLKVDEIGNGGQGNQPIYEVKDGLITIKDKQYPIKLANGFYIIRKLTPVECERLQTLPDNYTEGISNTQRYKCLGNGWTVDVIAHILKGIKE